MFDGGESAGFFAICHGPSGLLQLEPEAIGLGPVFFGAGEPPLFGKFADGFRGSVPVGMRAGQEKPEPFEDERETSQKGGAVVPMDRGEGGFDGVEAFEESAECGGGVQVVQQRDHDWMKSGMRGRVGEGGSVGQGGGGALNAPQGHAGGLEAVPGEVEGLAVVAREEDEAEFAGVVALAHHIGDRVEIAERFAHFLLVNEEV